MTYGSGRCFATRTRLRFLVVVVVAIAVVVIAIAVVNDASAATFAPRHT
jgi:hypothetical protein